MSQPLSGSPRFCASVFRSLSLYMCVCVCACCPLLSIAPLCALLSCRISALPVSIQGHVHWKSALWCCSRLRHSACHCVSVHVGTCSRCPISPWALALVRCCIMHRRRMCSDWRFVHAWCMSGIELGIESGTAGLQGLGAYVYLGTAEWAVRLKFGTKKISAWQFETKTDAAFSVSNCPSRTCVFFSFKLKKAAKFIV